MADTANGGGAGAVPSRCDRAHAAAARAHGVQRGLDQTRGVEPELRHQTVAIAVIDEAYPAGRGS